MISDERDNVIKRLDLSGDVAGRLDVYVSFLEETQAVMNLIADSTLPVVWTRHVWDSAQLSALLEPSDKIVLDLGSGAGFPGIVLALMNPDKTFHLTESEGRKSDFLKEAALKCGAENVVVHNDRIEKLPSFAADVITARALAPLDKLAAYALPFMKKGTRCLFMKGKKADEELKACLKKFAFKVEKVQSQTSGEGRILCMTEVRKK